MHLLDPIDQTMWMLIHKPHNHSLCSAAIRDSDTTNKKSCLVFVSAGFRVTLCQYHLYSFHPGNSEADTLTADGVQGAESEEDIWCLKSISGSVPVCAQRS